MTASPTIPYVCSFRYDGREHTVHVYATDELDCSRRLRAIGMTAQVDGELIAEIPLASRSRWLLWLTGAVAAILTAILGGHL